MFKELEDYKSQRKEMDFLNKVEETFFENRVLYLSGEIGSKETIQIIKKLYKLDETNAEIKIYIALKRISFQNALMLFDVIRNLKSKVITYALGYVNEYSIYILLAGKDRKALKHTRCFIPKFRFDVFDKKTNLDNYKNLKNKIINNLKGSYEVSGAKEIKNFLEEEIFLNARDMLKKNIIDEIKEG